MTTQKGQQVDLNDLSVQQLSSIKKQLDDELEHYTSSFSKLRGAQAKFRECSKAIQDGVSSKTIGKPLLVPLTTSLYVSGQLADSGNVIVDVGTGFYVEKSTEDAGIFYNNRMDDVGKSLKGIENIVQNKSNSLRIVEDVLRQKVISSNSTATE